MLSKISENTIQLEQSSFSQWLNTENNPVSRIRKTGEGMTNVNKDGEQNLIHLTNESEWTLEEEYLFFEAHSIIGNKWSLISKFVSRRNDNSLKNHFYSSLRKLIRRFKKEKCNYSNLKDKVKAFYSSLYVKTIVTNKQKESNLISNNNIFTEINALIRRKELSLEKISSYLNKLSLLILEDEEVKKFFSFKCGDALSVEFIRSLIGNVVKVRTIVRCIKSILNKPNTSNEFFEFLSSNMDLFRSVLLSKH